MKRGERNKCWIILMEEDVGGINMGWEVSKSRRGVL